MPAHRLLVIRQAKDCSHETKAGARLSARTPLGPLRKEPPSLRLRALTAAPCQQKFTAVRSPKGGSETHWHPATLFTCIAPWVVNSVSVCLPPSTCWICHSIISCFSSFILRLMGTPLYKQIIIIQASNNISNHI